MSANSPHDQHLDGPGSNQSDADDREYEAWYETRVGAEHRWCLDCNTPVLVLGLKWHWREEHRAEKGEDV